MTFEMTTAMTFVRKILRDGQVTMKRVHTHEYEHARLIKHRHGGSPTVATLIACVVSVSDYRIDSLIYYTVHLSLSTQWRSKSV